MALVQTLLVALIVALALACAQEPAVLPLPEGPAWAIVGVGLLDPVNGASGPATVVVQGDRIVAVEAGGAPELPERVERHDGSGLFLLPGLWDLHTHLAMADPAAPPLLVTQGVTGVRDLGAKLEEIEALRGKILAGEILGPRIVRTGPTLNGALNGPQHRVIDSAESARRAVADLAAAGVDLLKTHNATGREAYFALLEAAEEANLQVVGHIPTAVEPMEACAAGQASIEHIATIFEGTYLSRFEGELEAFQSMSSWLEDEAPELVRCMAEHQTLFVPTLRAYEYRAHFASEWDDPRPGWRFVTRAGYEAWHEGVPPTAVDRRPMVIELRESLVEVGAELVRRLHEAGAPVGAGTDLASPGLLPGFDLHAEIRLLAGAGLSARDALRAATRGPGAASGGDPLDGQLVAGAPANLVLLRADAFEDLAALDAIEGVVLRGRLMDREVLDGTLAKLEAAGPSL